MTHFKKLLLLALAGFTFSTYAQDANVRISWDYNSYLEQTSVNVVNKNYTETECFYPRIKQLNDGSLLMVFMNHRVGFDIFIRKSYDNGATWSDATMVRQRLKEASPTTPDDEKIFATPDFYQLANGRILLAYQWRYAAGYNDTVHTNESCGIELMTSDNNGLTFSEPREIYQGRCWEPYFLELPSGEIHLYITDSSEVRWKRSQACVALFRSFDNGKTWQNKKTATYKDGEALSRTIEERGKFDGMPAAQQLINDQGIAMAIETWSAVCQHDITPYIIYSPKNENWKYKNDEIRAQGGPEKERKKQLHKDFRGFGPYMEKLPTGEILVQTNGTYKKQPGMWLFIGDSKGDNFGYASTPYEGYWGSIAHLNNNEVMSAGTYTYQRDGKDHDGIRMMKGKLHYAKKIKKGELKLQKLQFFDNQINNDWFIGQETASSAYLNFGYSNRSFDFTTYLFDKNLIAFQALNSDAIDFLFYRKNTKTGKSETYRLAVNAKGVFSLFKEQTNSWVPQDASDVKDIVVDLNGTINNDKDEDLGFAAKVSVPWNLIGGLPTKNEQFRVHLRHSYKDNTKEYPFASLESIAGENSDIPETWLSISFE
ncbi:hypothetical protein FACS189413_01840 [Bacteroidia bacterium]|nr:hypothetical protein FACS189413_01840 [Bacteroidia bacterium]